MNLILYVIIIIVLTGLLLTVNIILGSQYLYEIKKSSFECGFFTVLYQNRTQFSIMFFIFALLFLLFDLEILLIYPYALSIYSNSISGLIVMLIFFLILTIGFIFEIGNKALIIV